ncbi:type II toxin-antitoxin system HicB family antitoxin [Candidatus Kuenenia stuttgartiensis]|nr:hypothetical protein [Candidatus Kuenenia stuttgartiensis]
MKIQVILEPSDEGGFTAIVPSLPGCIVKSIYFYKNLFFSCIRIVSRVLNSA